MGRTAGLSESKEESRSVPAAVRSGNLARMTAPVSFGLDVAGKRRERALGRRLKPGHVESDGMPQSSKIWSSFFNHLGRSDADVGVCLPWTADPLRSSPEAAVAW